MRFLVCSVGGERWRTPASRAATCDGRYCTLCRRPGKRVLGVGCTKDLGPTRPPPMKSTVIEICSRSSKLHSPPQFPRCSRKMLVEPYVKIKALSTNSADGVHRLLADLGRMFHACRMNLSVAADMTYFCYKKRAQLTHPSSPKHPAHRPRVKMPSQKKIPPLIQCANPLKTFRPSYYTVSF